MSSRTNTATLADIRAEIEAHGDRFSARPADTLQALDLCAKITRQSLAVVPASLPAVNAILNGILWQNVGFKSKKRHDNWRGLVRGALRKSRKAPKSHILLSPRQYPAEWKAWIGAVDKAVKDKRSSPFLRADVSAIPAWSAANGILPADFDDATAQLMANWYMKNRPSNGRRPNRYVKDAVAAWNALARAGIGGCMEVARPLGRGRNRNIQISEMPASLVADIEAYIHYSRTRSTVGEQAVETKPVVKGGAGGRFAHLRGAAIHDVVTDNRAVKQKRGKSLGPVSEETVKGTYHNMRTLISAGARRVKDLSDPECPVLAPIPLVEGVRLKAFLNNATMVDGFAMLAARMEDDGKIDETTDQASLTSSFHTFGAKVCAVAAWAKIDESELEQMRVVIRSAAVKTDSVGAMPAVRRELLDEMDDPIKVLAWFRAPGALWKRAEDARKKGIMDWEVVRDGETAFIAWLLSRLPIRRKNLGQLTIRAIGKEEAMIRLARFDGEQTVIVVPGRFTKTGRAVRFKVKGEGEVMLRGLLAKGGYREAAMKLGGFTDTEFLFVGDSHSFIKRKMMVRGHRSFAALGEGYKARMREFGIATTLHFARHIAAQIALDFDPSALAVVANLLGSSVKTVEKHYMSDRTSKAAEQFDAIVKGSISKALRILNEGEQE